MTCLTQPCSHGGEDAAFYRWRQSVRGAILRWRFIPLMRAFQPAVTLCPT